MVTGRLCSSNEPILTGFGTFFGNLVSTRRNVLMRRQSLSRFSRPIIAVLLGNLLIACTCAFMALEFASSGRQNRGQPSQQAANDGYLTDFSEILPREAWLIDEPYTEAGEDLAGWHFSITDHTVTSAQNIENPLAYVRQHIIRYLDAEHAHERYLAQEDWIFVRNFGVPPSVQIFSYRDLNRPEGTHMTAEEYRLACEESTADTRCSGLFLYDTRVVFIDVFMVRDGVRYLSDEDLFRIFRVVDEWYG